MKLHDSTDDGIPTPRVFSASTENHFRAIIETSLITLTAVRRTLVKRKLSPSSSKRSESTTATSGEVEPESSSVESSESLGEMEECIVGFIALSDTPTSDSAVMASLLKSKLLTSVSPYMTPHTSVWLRMLLAPPSAAFLSAEEVVRGRGGCFAALKRGSSDINATYTAVEMVKELFRVSLGSLSSVEHVLTLISASYNCLKATGAETLVDLTDSTTSPFSLLHWDRSTLIAPLLLRRGRIEDYDDIVALLVGGGPGIITALPRDLYIEEVLQDQNHVQKVVVVEHTVTHEVLGVACLRQVTLEEQYQMARLYETDALQQFKPISLSLISDGEQPAQHSTNEGRHDSLLEVEALDVHNRL